MEDWDRETMSSEPTLGWVAEWNPVLRKDTQGKQNVFLSYVLIYSLALYQYGLALMYCVLKQISNSLSTELCHWFCYSLVSYCECKQCIVTYSIILTPVKQNYIIINGKFIYSFCSYSCEQPCNRCSLGFTLALPLDWLWEVW